MNRIIIAMAALVLAIAVFKDTKRPSIEIKQETKTNNTHGTKQFMDTDSPDVKLFTYFISAKQCSNHINKKITIAYSLIS